MTSCCARCPDAPDAVCHLPYGHPSQHEAEVLVSWGLPGAPGWSYDE